MPLCIEKRIGFGVIFGSERFTIQSCVSHEKVSWIFSEISLKENRNIKSHIKKIKAQKNKEADGKQILDRQVFTVWGKDTWAISTGMQHHQLPTVPLVPLCPL